MQLLKACQDLIVSYAGLVLLMPDMFPQPEPYYSLLIPLKADCAHHGVLIVPPVYRVQSAGAALLARYLLVSPP